MEACYNNKHLQILVKIFKHQVYLLVNMDNIKEFDDMRVVKFF